MIYIIIKKADKLEKEMLTVLSLTAEIIGIL